MPVLPLLRPRALTAADTRILESRQLLNAAQHAAHSLSAHARELWRRYTPVLLRRESTDCQHRFISACYAGLNAGPAPGAIVGITLGSIAGFLIILYLLWILSNGSTFIRTTALEVDEDVVVTRRRSRSPRNTRRSQRSNYNAEMRRVSSPRRERVIRQERIVRDVPPPRRESSRMRETIIEESTTRRDDRRVDGDDVVEVFEENSSISGTAPPPRRKNRRGSSYR